MINEHVCIYFLYCTFCYCRVYSFYFLSKESYCKTAAASEMSGLLRLLATLFSLVLPLNLYRFIDNSTGNTGLYSMSI